MAYTSLPAFFLLTKFQIEKARRCIRVKRKEKQKGSKDAGSKGNKKEGKGSVKELRTYP
jgi:hypothetical protein